ncbi:MAG: hypothetical protein U9R40_07025 [Synergistota bacterium]|nr:hypothetical protein [Synergistota bacterium]
MCILRRRGFGKKVIIVFTAFALACLATYVMFHLKINNKVEAIEMVKEQLTKDRRDAFVSRVNTEGKFKLTGWDIDNCEGAREYIVSYSLRRLNEDGFKVGDPVGYWYHVDVDNGVCEQIYPEDTVTLAEPKQQ